MSFAPLRLDGGGCAQVLALSPDGKTLVAGADTQGMYMSQTSPLATTWTVQNNGIGKSTFFRQCAALLWSSSEGSNSVIYAGTGSKGANGGLLAGTLHGTWPNQRITWALRAARPQWAGNHAAAPVPTAGGISRPAGNLLAQDASFLYAGTYQLGVLRSSNTGGSGIAGDDNFPVAATMAGAPPGTGNWFCFALARDPVSGNLYAGFFDSTGTPAGLWQCANPQAGTPNFTQIAGGPAMAVDLAVVGGYVYAAGGNDGLWRYGPIAGSPAWQNLNGATIPAPAGTTANYWSSVAGYVDGSANHVVLIADNNTQDPTKELYTATVPSNYPTGAITYAANGTTIVATEPPGYTWYHASSSYKNWFGGQGFFQPHITVDSSNLAAVNVYCAGSEGCARSLSGAQWRIANSGMPQFLGHPVAASPSRPGHVIFGDSDFCVWDDTAPGLETAATLVNDPPVNSTQGFSVAFSADGNTVYAGQGQKYSNAGGEVWSRPWNQPANWTALGLKAATGGKVPIGMAAFNDAGGNKILLAAVWGSGMWRYAPAPGTGIYGWLRVDASVGAASGTSLPVTYAGGGLVYCYDRGTGVHRSRDYGATWALVWNKAGNTATGTVAYNPVVAGELWVSTTTGLWRLPGADTGTVTGGSIIPRAPAAPLPGQNGAVAFDNAGNLIVALQDNGSGSGLVSSPDSGNTWADIVGDFSFAQANCNPELIAVGGDNHIYVSGSNVVAHGFASSGGPPPGVSAPFTPVQSGQNIAGSGGQLGAWFNQPGGNASQAGTLLIATLVLADSSPSQVVTAPPGWQLVLDVPSGTGSGNSRVQEWAYLNNPGGLGAPPAAQAPPQDPPPMAGWPGLQAGGQPFGLGPTVNGPGPLPAGGAEQPVIFSYVTNTSVKGKISEYSTPPGTLQYLDQTGSASALAAATSFPVTASAANAYTGGLAKVIFGANFSSAPSGQTWTTPGGWAVDGVANNSTNVWSTYNQAGTGAGPITVTGTISTSVNMTSWAAALATFYALPVTAVSITTLSCPAGTQGSTYSKTLAAAGGATPYAWTLTAGSLPPGLSLSPGGVISGVPSTAGAYAFTVTVTDAALQAAARPFTIVIAGTVTVTTSSLPAGAVGAAYGPGGAVAVLAAAGGTPPYTWAVTAGPLPPGLGLSAAGTISGTPLLTGTYPVTVRAADTLAAAGSAALSITITTGPLTVTTRALAAASLGAPYTAQLAAQGGTPPYTWAVTSGTLPPGITLASAGALSGTPTVQGAFTFTAQVTDSLSATASASFTITVNLAVPAIGGGGPWRILYGPAQPKGGITGEILQAQNKTITLRTEPGQNHEVSFDADGRDPAIAGITELTTDLTVMFGTRIIFCGRVVPTQDTLTASAHRTQVTALDYREVLRRRAVLPGDQLSWTSADQAVIAWNLIQATQARPGGNLGIARGTGQSTGVTRTWTAALGDYAGDDITALATLNNGFEWQVTPYGFADLRLDVFYPQQGASRGVVLGQGGRISSITRTVDPSAFADSVYVTSSGGGGALTPQHLEAADIATRPEQRWDLVTGTQDQTQSTLNDDAAALLNQSQVVVPSYVIQFYPGTWGGPSDIWLGDTVTVQISSGRLQVNDTLRVAELSFAISADNVETLTATVGAIPFRLNKKIASILKQIRYIKTR